MARVNGSAAVTGFVAGVIGGLIVPMIPRSAWRSAAKGAVKGALGAYDYGRQAANRSVEWASDLAAEVKLEELQASLVKPTERDDTVTPLKREQASASRASDG